MQNGTDLDRFPRITPDEELIIIQGCVREESTSIREAVMNAARDIVLEADPVKKAEKLAKVLVDNAINADYIPQIVQSVLDANSRAERLGNELANYTHDTRTGLPTRKYYETWFPTVLSTARRNVDRGKMDPHQIQMIFFDVDKFKLVNDSLGHSAGDDVLAEVGIILGDELGRIIREEVPRTSDGVFRWGGEEYCGIMLDCNMEVAAQKADKIREKIASTPINVHGMDEPIYITISAGVASLNLAQRIKGANEEIINDLTENADLALYAAKERGRNRVVRFSDVTHEEFVAASKKKEQRSGKDEVDTDEQTV